MKVKEITVSSFYNRCSPSTYGTITKSETRKTWVKDRDLFMAELLIDGMGEVKRIVTPVVIKNITYPTDNKPVYMMDAITGTLYDIATGECLTSDNIKMLDFVYRKNLSAELLKMRVHAQGDV